MADPSTSSTVQSSEPAAIVRKGVAIARHSSFSEKERGAHIHVAGYGVGDGVWCHGY